MAVTKNHPINSTLKKAIEYICNPDKTDGTLLIDSYGCTPETADIEFAWTHKKAAEKTTHLARHLIQSFAPGETTPQQAHEIGKRLADEILGGKYEYILSTHTDRNHIQNHIIFNDVSFVDYGTVISIKNGITKHARSATVSVMNTACRLFRRMRIKAKAISNIRRQNKVQAIRHSLKRILTKLSESRLTTPIFCCVWKSPGMRSSKGNIYRSVQRTESGLYGAKLWAVIIQRIL